MPDMTAVFQALGELEALRRERDEALKAKLLELQESLRVLLEGWEG